MPSLDLGSVVGPEGPEGPQGIQGVPGPHGSEGPYFTPAVSTTGVISWENTGGLENPPDVDLAAATKNSIGNATANAAGLMSSGDKAKLDGVAAGATANAAYTGTPNMDGTASAGSSANYSRGDHRHPTDTTREAVSNKINSITSASTNTQYPSAKAVWDLFNSETGMNPEMHRNWFRGKNLGPAVTDAQKSAIRNETFDDLFVGDYWVINGVTWRIADINYWLGIGSGEDMMETPHLVIVPDDSLYISKMNDTRTTAGGYAGSKMRSAYLETARATVKSAFGSMLLTHKVYLTNAVTNGHPSGGAWYDSDVELPNEIMFLGTSFFAPRGDGSINMQNQTIDNTQLALMRLCRRFIFASTRLSGTWFRDVASSETFAIISNYGPTNMMGTNNNEGVRPVFAIG